MKTIKFLMIIIGLCLLMPSCKEKDRTRIYIVFTGREMDKKADWDWNRWLFYMEDPDTDEIITCTCEDGEGNCYEDVIINGSSRSNINSIFISNTEKNRYRSNENIIEQLLTYIPKDQQQALSEHKAIYKLSSEIKNRSENIYTQILSAYDPNTNELLFAQPFTLKR
ncbi:MAG: hypothetical protein ACEPOV_00350 [Hyphomicrobiales bacterium]